MNISLHKLPTSSKNLPCTLMLLEDWKLIKIQGKDTIQYLQGQLTCDLNDMNINQYRFSAHCNPRGKMISNMYVLYFNSGIALIERKNIYNKQVTEMKKYAIFSKVEFIIDDDTMIYGIAGLDARKILKNFFKKLPNKTKTVIHDNNISILYIHLPIERFLLIIRNKKNKIIEMLKEKIQINNSLQWTSLDIEAGYPIINIENSEKIIPQAANMHLLNGISFNKGCYIGQEIIARTKYKNTNKQALYWLIGTDNNKNLPVLGNNLEIKIRKNWKTTGLILESCKINTGEIWIQAILHYPISENYELRTIKEKTILNISNLPYSILNKNDE